jgi:hypothetical protein
MVNARSARFLITVLLACGWTGISVVPVKAVPIARGLSAFADLEKADLPKNPHTTRYISECVGEITTLRLITFTAENWAASADANQPGSIGVSYAGSP